MKKIFILNFVTTSALIASPIVWGPPQDVDSSSDISRNGLLVEAFNLSGGGNSANLTINGVAFRSRTDLLPSNTTVDVFGATTNDASYDALLSSIDFGGGTNSVSVNLGNGELVPGENYEIQAWYADTRSIRVTPLGDGVGNTVNLSSNGQFAVGTFTAQSPTQELTIQSPGFGQAHLNAYQIRQISGVPTYPVTTLSTTDNILTGPFTVTVSFSESVTGLTESDFSVTNGSIVAGSLSGSGAIYTIEVNPATLNNPVIITLPANTVSDFQNELNQQPSSLSLSDTVLEHTVTLLTPHENVFAPFDVTLHFDTTQITGLLASEINVTNGSVTNLVNHQDGNYTATITPINEGQVSLSVPAGVAVASDTGFSNIASSVLTTDFTLSPMAEISGVLNSDAKEFDVFLTFTPQIEGFNVDDLIIINGSVVSSEMQGRRDFADRFYKVRVRASKPGNVTVQIPSNIVTNQDHPNETNTASNVWNTLVTDDFGEAWVIDSAAEWATNTDSSSNLNISDGLAEPSANVATFTSAMQVYPTRRQATEVTFTQSNAWDNWVPIGNVGPNGAGNAPVFLSIGNDDYYFFGENTGSAYHTWHSTDMVNWTRLDQFSHNSYRWCTSAEYKDGTFYLLNDSPNDHTPHLFTDTDLNNGQVGVQRGMVFNDPTDGGDSVLFRDNADDRFHIISEDWSPVNASTHSFDSPLANHVSSPDGITGFTEGEHLPPIDFRTTPTGNFGAYNHNFVGGTHRSNPQRYEIHDGAQKAFGDWSAIKVGERYYLFGDYEHNDENLINVGILSSDSLNDQFELVGDVGQGHPDPDIGFAEGQFYLITQQNTDFISPGPWVDGVEARAGVDTDGNGTIDVWTEFQDISESYDHTPGYAKIVTTTPASIDMSGLPAGFGFQFEFTLNDTVVSDVSPIMDKVVMDFEPSNFQKWANAKGIPADPNGDGDGNGIKDLIDFTLANPFSPEVSGDGTFDITVNQGAADDGIIVGLRYSLDLETWMRANDAGGSISFSQIQIDQNGNSVHSFELNIDEPNRLFFSVELGIPE